MKGYKIEIIDIQNSIVKKGNLKSVKFYDFAFYCHYAPEGYKRVGNYLIEKVSQFLN